MLGLVAGCGDAVLIVVDGDREVPSQVDTICLAVADRDPAGGQFGRSYRLEGSLASLPQSLAAHAGGASSAETWVRGFRGGVEVADDRADVDFGGDVALRIDRCAPGSSSAPVASTPVGPASAAIAISQGRGGTEVIAVGADGAARVSISGAAALDAAPAGALGVVAIDVDGDCDDDVVVWTASEAHLLVRDVDDFTDRGVVASFAVRAGAAADVDRDGDQDLVLGGGGQVHLYRADAGALSEDGVALQAAVTDVTALALGDVDGDGNPDLIVGQSGAPLRAYVNDPSGTGVFAAAPALLPSVDRDVAALALADLDGDDDVDLAAAIIGAAPRVYVNRGGLLEDQSFVRLPAGASARALAAADWNGDCRPDLALAGASTALLAGSDTGAFTADATADGATAAAFTDLDGDGARDLVLATAQGVTWLAR